MTFKKARTENAKSRQIRILARRIPNALALDRILCDAKPELRWPVFERIRPFLPFAVEAKELPCLAGLAGSGEAEAAAAPPAVSS